LKPASSPAASGSFPAASNSRAVFTTRMLLAVATPMQRMVPVSAGTLRVVPVANSIHEMPASEAGKPQMMTKGSVQDWKFTVIRRYTSATAKIRPSPRPTKDSVIDCTWPRTVMVAPAGSFLRAASTSFVTSAATPARSRPCTAP